MPRGHAVFRFTPRFTLLPIALAAALAQPAIADDGRAAEIAALRVEMQRLQERLAALETAATAAALPPVATVPATPPDTLAGGSGLEVADAEAGTSFGIGGRIHYDVYAHDTDRVPATGGSEFRRVRVHVEGEAAEWGYRVQVELSGRNTDLRDVYLERGFGDTTLTLGQFKPFRSMDELTSSNDISAMERGFGSASGLFADRQWQQGIGLLHATGSGSIGLSAFSLREDNTPRNEGWGAATRATWAPLREGDRLVHLGAWHSHEQGGRDTPAAAIEVAYGGRRGPEALLFESVGGPGFEARASGLEFAGTLGSFHWQGEWSRARFAGMGADGRLEAGYLQAGWLFGGVREYDVDEGVFGSPAQIGGGLWEAVARLDRVALRGVDGVEARRVVLGVNWYATDDVRFMLNWTRGEDLATGDEPSQLAFRAQYAF